MASKLSRFAVAALAVCLVTAGCGGKPQRPASPDNAPAAPVGKLPADDLSNWPSANPQAAPADKRFEKLSPDELVPWVLGDKHEDPDGRPMSQILACATFLWKTRGDDSARSSLAGRIAERLSAAADKKRFDFPYLASFLGPLRAHDRILQLLAQVRTLDCCYGPQLLIALGECRRATDVLAVLPLMDKETDASRGLVNDTLCQWTGHEVKWTNAEDCRRAWTAWVEAGSTKHE